MTEIESEIFSFLNKEAYKELHSVSGFLKRNLKEEIVGKEREDILTEVKCFDFFFQNGELKPIAESVDTLGNSICYPDISKLTDEEIKYLEERLKSDLHPFPKSRYAHILWKIKKHNTYAFIAADSYNKLTEIYFEKSLEGKELFHHLCSVLQCYHKICVNTKYSLDECKTGLLSWLKNDLLPATWKDNILEIIIDSPLFNKNDFKGLTSLMLSFITGVQEYFMKDKYLKSCLNLAQKEGVPTNEIFNLLGENEMAMAHERQNDESGMILISCYQKAAYYFKLADNEKMHNEVSALYTKQKSKLKLNLFQYEFPSEEIKVLNEEQNTLVDKVLSDPEIGPYKFLVHSGRLLVKEDILEKEAKENMKGLFMYMANMQVYDLNNNAKTLNETDKLAHQKFLNYSFRIQLSTIPLIEKLLYKGIKTGKLNRESIFYFFNQTWLAEGLDGFSSDGRPERFSWLTLLFPGLYELITQVEAEILDKGFKANFLLAIDSLSIKIEGIIRDLARLCGISVTKIKEEEAQEMNLEELFRQEEITKIFHEEDILFWRYLLTKQGWNIRNNVSHSFYRPGDYNRQKAILLLLAIFRLCKYSDVGR